MCKSAVGLNQQTGPESEPRYCFFDLACRVLNMSLI
jgi:hypothetical protein